MQGMKKDLILLIAQINDLPNMRQIIGAVADRYNAELIAISNPIDGFKICNDKNPCMIIIDADISVLSGFSFCSILQGTGNKSLIYMLIENEHYKVDLLNKLNINCFLMKTAKELISYHLMQFFEKRMMKNIHEAEIQRAKMHQDNILPQKIRNDAFCVDYLYSPYNDLSGDCIDFWYGEDPQGLYGFLFDCAGHDIYSFSQVGEVRAHFRYGFNFYKKGMYKSISDILRSVNEEIFSLHGNKTLCVAAVAFHLDFSTNNLKYCSAGMPSFFARRDSGKYEKIEMINPLIGYKKNANYEQKALAVHEMSEIIFSSDGFSELLYKDNKVLPSPQHDDVSAIYIQLRRKDERNELCKNEQ